MPSRAPRPLQWLRWQWIQLLAGTAPEEAANGVGGELLERYAEPARRYHTAEHLAEVLQTVRSLSNPADPGATFRLATDDDYRAVSFAAWFHDAVYDPTSTGNEEASAALATERLTDLGLGPPLVAEVGRLVRLTERHDVASGDDNAMVLIDADLAILAARRARYDRYASGIRAEYAHVSDDEFRGGRAGVLRRFLELGSIYHCDLMVRRCDENARRNLQRELEQLGGAPAPEHDPL